MLAGNNGAKTPRKKGTANFGGLWRACSGYYPNTKQPFEDESDWCGTCSLPVKQRPRPNPMGHGWIYITLHVVPWLNFGTTLPKLALAQCPEW